MRIATSQLFGNGIDAIQRQQAELNYTQLQLSTGKRILSPADDPGGAVQALKLRDRIAAVDQYSRNSIFATNRLQQEEGVLTSMGQVLQRVRELTVQAANATQSDESRAAIAVELRQISQGLIDSANTRDANGEYLFAGFRSSSRPFVENAAGTIEYLGDNGQREVALSPDRKVAVGDSGNAFMQVPRGNGVYVVTLGAANTGNAWVTGTDIVDATAIDNETYTISMTSPTDYEVLDSTATVVATGTYASGQAINIGGRRIVLEGDAATGDTFEVAPAGTDSVFAMLDELATALETPRSDDASRAQLVQSTGMALQNLDQALDSVLELRTSIGARLTTIENYGLSNEDRKLQLQTALSSLEDLDYAEAVGRLALQQAALEAAQQTYAQLGRLSLFNFIR